MKRKTVNICILTRPKISIFFISLGLFRFELPNYGNCSASKILCRSFITLPNAWILLSLVFSLTQLPFESTTQPNRLIETPDFFPSFFVFYSFSFFLFIQIIIETKNLPYIFIYAICLTFSWDFDWYNRMSWYFFRSLFFHFGYLVNKTASTFSFHSETFSFSPWKNFNLLLFFFNPSCGVYVCECVIWQKNISGQDFIRFFFELYAWQKKFCNLNFIIRKSCFFPLLF